MHIGKSYNFFSNPSPTITLSSTISPAISHNYTTYPPPLYRTDADATVSECTVGGLCDNDAISSDDTISGDDATSCVLI